jgi:hypothetical protein
MVPGKPVRFRRLRYGNLRELCIYSINHAIREQLPVRHRKATGSRRCRIGNCEPYKFTSILRTLSTRRLNRGSELNGVVRKVLTIFLALSMVR